MKRNAKPLHRVLRLHARQDCNRCRRGFANPGVLLWRALLNWFGGIGIIVMAIAILPVLRVGGMQLFRTESSDRGDKPFATVRDTANGITLTYLGLTVFSTVLFNLAGMDWFDAVCHAMAAV